MQCSTADKISTDSASRGTSALAELGVRSTMSIGDGLRHSNGCSFTFSRSCQCETAPIHAADM